MDYQLCKKDNASTVLAQGDFSDDFSAENWAREWAQKSGTSDDYLIKRADGGLTSQLFRTNAGQWYIMRQ